MFFLYIFFCGWQISIVALITWRYSLAQIVRIYIIVHLMSAINKLIICDNSNKFATAKKVRKNWGWGGRGRGKYTIMYVRQRKKTSGRAVARSFVEIQQFGGIIEWCEQQWRKRWWSYLQNLQDLLDRSERKKRRLGSMRYMPWIYLPKMLWQDRYMIPRW